jgi:hypothetical protein
MYEENNTNINDLEDIMQTNNNNKTHRNGQKSRKTKQYWQEYKLKERAAQNKVRPPIYTNRQPEIPTEEDERMNDIHFANFLGCGQYIKNGRVSYNGRTVVNINECDSHIENVDTNVTGSESTTEPAPAHDSASQQDYDNAHDYWYAIRDEYNPKWVNNNDEEKEPSEENESVGWEEEEDREEFDKMAEDYRMYGSDNDNSDYDDRERDEHDNQPSHLFATILSKISKSAAQHYAARNK